MAVQFGGVHHVARTSEMKWKRKRRKESSDFEAMLDEAVRSIDPLTLSRKKESSEAKLDGSIDPYIRSCIEPRTLSRMELAKKYIHIVDFSPAIRVDAVTFPLYYNNERVLWLTPGSIIRISTKKTETSPSKLIYRDKMLEMFPSLEEDGIIRDNGVLLPNSLQTLQNIVRGYNKGTCSSRFRVGGRTLLCAETSGIDFGVVPNIITHVRHAIKEVPDPREEVPDSWEDLVSDMSDE